jgi:HD-GYP domain-containing protein (c-di-GMP phosphodiesterase class II)
LVYPSQRECSSAEKLHESLTVANAIMIQANEETEEELFEHNQIFVSHQSRIINATILKSDSITNQVSRQITLLKQELFDKIKHNQHIFYHNYSTLPTRQTLKQDKVLKLKNSFYTYQHLANNEDGQKYINEIVSAFINAPNWEEISSLSAAAALAQLESINAKAQVLNTTIINYNMKQTGCCRFRVDDFIIRSNSKQDAVKIGDTFETDLLVSKPIFNHKGKLSFYIDNQLLLTKDNVAHYQKRFSKAGKQSIFAKAILYNPITGQIDSVQKEYIVEVLP